MGSHVFPATHVVDEPAGVRWEGALCTPISSWVHRAARSGLRRWTVAVVPQDPKLSARGKRDSPLRFGGRISWVLAGEGASQGCRMPLSKRRRLAPHTEHTDSRGHAESAGTGQPPAESWAPYGPERARRSSGLGCSPGSPRQARPSGTFPRPGTGPQLRASPSSLQGYRRGAKASGRSLGARRRPLRCLPGQALRVSQAEACGCAWPAGGSAVSTPRCRAPRLSNRERPAVLRSELKCV